ncbi:ABC transporter permease [Planctomycetota bacterium]
MRPILLVGLREYAENARTKGFWIGLFLFPVLILICLSVPQLLEKATPTRHFVLVDQSGQFEEVIEAGLARLHQKHVLEAFTKYVQKHKRDMPSVVSKIDLEQTPAASPEELLEQFAGGAEALDAFLDSGGIDFALRQIRPFLREDAPEFEEPRHKFRRLPLPGDVPVEADLDTVAQELKPYLRGERKVAGTGGETAKLFAAILVPSGVEERVVRPGLLASITRNKRSGIQYWGINLADQELQNSIKRLLNQEVRRREYVARGMDAETVQSVQRTHLPFASLDPKKEEGQEEVSIADVIRQWAPVGFVYLLWIAIFTISQMLLNNTIEEKSNRIIEVLLSSVTARELMLGKLFGIAAVGLTMLVAWIGSLVGILAVKAGPEAEVASKLFEVLRTSGLIPAFAVYFLLGYLMYAGIFLAMGAVCNTLKEAQNLMAPVMMVMIVPLLTMMFIPKDPNGTLATIMSWIPIYTPFVMMNRAAADPPLVDIIGTLVLLVATTVLILWLTGKIFRVGILRTGQPPRFLELLRWLRGTQ